MTHHFVDPRETVGLHRVTFGVEDKGTIIRLYIDGYCIIRITENGLYRVGSIGKDAGIAIDKDSGQIVLTN